MLIFIGLLVLAVTWWDYNRGEADTILLFDAFWWWDFERNEHPLIFMVIILGQVVFGVGCIFYGILH